jgi:hypothetical protein
MDGRRGCGQTASNNLLCDPAYDDTQGGDNPMVVIRTMRPLLVFLIATMVPMPAYGLFQCTLSASVLNNASVCYQPSSKEICVRLVSNRRCYLYWQAGLSPTDFRMIISALSK